MNNIEVKYVFEDEYSLEIIYETIDLHIAIKYGNVGQIYLLDTLNLMYEQALAIL